MSSRVWYLLAFSLACAPTSPKAAERVAPSFTPWPGSPYLATYQPEDLAVGDFNNDGIADVVTSSTQGSASLLLGDGHGRLVSAPASPFYSGVAFIRSVRAADFDGDGNLDVAGVDTFLSSIVLLRGDGAGNLSPVSGSPFPSGNWAWHMAVGDFDRDGHVDIAIADSGSYAALVALNSGVGEFPVALQALYPVGANPVDILVADLTSDGYPDLVTADYNGGTVTILINDGTGHFSAGAPQSTEGYRPEDLAAGDFNEDGHVDVVCANEQSASLSIFLGDGAGSLALVNQVMLTTVWALAVGDIDGDGHQDIAVTGISPGNFTLLRGDGHGHFAVHDYGTELLVPLPYAVAIADMENTGREQLVTASIADDNFGRIGVFEYHKHQHIFSDGFDR